jgi:hypothetical protein
MLTAALLVNAAAFVAVLLVSRFDSRLVDDNGMAMERNGEWHELVVPAVQAPAQDAGVLV